MVVLVILFAFLVYIALFITVVWFAVRMARKRNIKGWKYGVPAGLIMYLIVFWDHIPTYVLHKYYCYTQAGYWDYKTPDQWMKENPGAMEKIEWAKGLASTVVLPNGTERYMISDRIVWDSHVRRNRYLPVSLYTHEMVDTKTLEVFNKEVSVASGFGNQYWKFWVGVKPCGPKLGRGMRPFYGFRGIENGYK